MSRSKSRSIWAFAVGHFRATQPNRRRLGNTGFDGKKKGQKFVYTNFAHTKSVDDVQRSIFLHTSFIKVREATARQTEQNGTGKRGKVVCHSKQGVAHTREATVYALAYNFRAVRFVAVVPSEGKPKKPKGLIS